MALKDEKAEQCIRSCGSEFQMWGPKQEKVLNSKHTTARTSKTRNTNVEDGQTNCTIPYSTGS